MTNIPEALRVENLKEYISVAQAMVLYVAIERIAKVIKAECEDNQTPAYITRESIGLFLGGTKYIECTVEFQYYRAENGVSMSILNPVYVYNLAENMDFRDVLGDTKEMCLN